MKAQEALIAWTPGTDRIAIGSLLREGDHDWTKPYEFTGGAAHTDRRQMDDLEAALMVFVDLNTIVVRDGVHPQAAHRAFLMIDQYRDHISPDMDGAS